MHYRSKSGIMSVPSGFRLAHLAGFFSGLAILFPLSGRILGYPAALPALGFLALAVLFFVPTRWRLRALGIGFLALSTLLGILILTSATPDQFTFLTSPGLWRQNADLYQQSKLFMVLLYGGPAFVAAAVVLFSADNESAVDGVMLSATLVAFIAAGRMASHAELIGSDFMTARNWIKDGGVFGQLSYGALFTIGAIAAMRFRFGWIAAAIFLLCAALLSRRAETLIIFVALVAVLLYSAASTRNLRRIIAPVLAIAVAAVGFALLHNGHNVRYFGNILLAVQSRFGLLQDSIASASTTGIFGMGLGAYADIDPRRLYPHNIFIETFAEVGAIASLLALAIAAIPAAVGIYGIVKRTITYRQMLALGMSVAVTTLALKSGDMTSLGRMMFFAALAVAAREVASRAAIRPRAHDANAAPQRIAESSEG